MKLVWVEQNVQENLLDISGVSVSVAVNLNIDSKQNQTTIKTHHIIPFVVRYLDGSFSSDCPLE